MQFVGNLRKNFKNNFLIKKLTFNSLIHAMAQSITNRSQRIGYYRCYTDAILGKGNFATVYRARHKLIGCEVALKVINTNDIEEQEYVNRNLFREANILRDLHHPNIIRLYETVKTMNLYCLSLELIRGVNLYQYVKEQKKVSEKLARTFFYQMLSAVQYMHKLNVIHRDLKLENVLVEFGKVIKIADFGLSNVYYPCFKLRTHCGSVEYAAPELFRTVAYGTAADIWSLGVILYVMLVGKMPFAINAQKKTEAEDEESAQTPRDRQIFIKNMSKRISKGLMQENWELMEDLNPDCWNFLHDLLEPDQFLRISIDSAINHYWITKDVTLMKRLPQRRKDLHRRLYPQIIEYLAIKLNTSKDRIEKHLKQFDRFQNDQVSSMFYIVRDALVKDVLYPPPVIETSFLYRFECWQKRKISNRQYYHDYKYLNETDKNYSYSSKFTLPSCNKIETDFQLSSMHSITKDTDDMKLQVHSKINSVKKPVTITVKSSTKLSQGLLEDAKFDKTVKCNDEHLDDSKTRKPYRSYRNSRPNHVKNNICIDKGEQNVSNLKHIKSMESSILEKQCKEFSTVHCQESFQKKICGIKQEDRAINHRESSSVGSVNKYKPGKSTTLTILKPHRNNSHSKDDKGNYAKIDMQSNSSTNNDLQVKDSNSSKKDKKERVRQMENSYFQETESKKDENGSNNLSHSRKPSIKKTDDRKMNSNETSSRLTSKNMRYGPPVPFLLPFNTPRAPMKNSGSGKNFDHSGGDTSEI